MPGQPRQENGSDTNWQYHGQKMGQRPIIGVVFPLVSEPNKFGDGEVNPETDPYPVISW
jgi:hypothetical protein